MNTFSYNYIEKFINDINLLKHMSFDGLIIPLKDLKKVRDSIDKIESGKRLSSFFILCHLRNYKLSDVQLIDPDTLGSKEIGDIKNFPFEREYRPITENGVYTRYNLALIGSVDFVYDHKNKNELSIQVSVFFRDKEDEKQIFAYVVREVSVSKEEIDRLVELGQGLVLKLNKVRAK